MGTTRNETGKARTDYPMDFSHEHYLGWNAIVCFYSSHCINLLTYSRMTFTVGVPFNALIVNLPQRFQALDGKDPFGAGIWLLPYTAVSPVCSVVSNVVASKGKVPLVYLLLAGGICHLVGVTLLSTLNKIEFPFAGLGYEAIAGAGVGITFSVLLLGTPFVVNPRDIGKCIKRTTI